MTVALTILTIALVGQTVAVLGVLARRAPTPAPRLTGRTVLVERAGGDGVVNLRGVVAAHHADRVTLTETQAVGPMGDVALQDPVVHVPTDVILSISEQPAPARRAPWRR